MNIKKDIITILGMICILVIIIFAILKLNQYNVKKEENTNSEYSYEEENKSEQIDEEVTQEEEE